MSILTAGCTQKQERNFIELSADQPRTEQLFDFGWKFYRGDIEGAEQPVFEDQSWRRVDLPHDWSIEDLPGTESPIDSGAIGAIAYGYLVGGTGWYRKTFFVPEEVTGKRIRILFEGVYMNADFWLNGQHLGHHPYGYTSFWYDITDKLLAGQNNVLAVEVKNEGRTSRWYPGSGIYRHVWLTVVDPLHIAPWGTYVTTPVIAEQSATVRISTRLVNSENVTREVTLVTRILNPGGDVITEITSDSMVEANTSIELIQELKIDAPERWSVESPVLYTAISEVSRKDAAMLCDAVKTSFGIRELQFSAEKGFQLNGKQLELKGGCMHHDNGPLGSAAFDRAEERRVELMKASGYNAIRCAHNPPSPAFLDACDRNGILVIDESFDMWDNANNPDDYHLYFNEWWQKDLESMVLRDRNHPSVIMWSIGNEIKNLDKPSGVETGKKQADYVRAMDPTRPITSAVNNISPAKDPYFALLDISGYNYARKLYISDHNRFPDRIMMATESYPLEAFEYWMAVLDHPWVIGDFVWTGYDYLGEASIGWMGYWHSSSFYPWTHAYCGDIDVCGYKRPQSFYRDALWMENALSLFVNPPVPSFNMKNPDWQEWSIWNWQDVVADWTWPGYEGQVLRVDAYSSCAEVELFLNGQSLGRLKTNRDTRFTASWDVTYQPGTLRVAGYDSLNEITSSELRTAGEPVSIQLSADRDNIHADGQDLSFITVDIVDENGFRNPKAQNLVTFDLQGPGTIAAVGSSNPMGLESFRLPRRKAYQGRCQVIIRAERKAGEIVLKAASEGLQPATIIVNSE
jgi:beta-galactosidase